ncbi:MAG: hypothetical protein JXR67_02460 [Bacteroidales bacterium]|nr:hypothetical protein [Bacteroidales bacterium]
MYNSVGYRESSVGFYNMLKQPAIRMREYTLNIAGYNIRLESQEDGPDLVPSPRFLQSIVRAMDYDVLIRVHHGRVRPDEDAERLFVAPYVVEVKGYKVTKSDNFWSVYKQNGDLLIITNFPDSPGKKATLKLSLALREWDLYIENAGWSTDPMEYPLDGLILYYLTAINADIMIHASGISYNGRGYLFSGVSGKGKTTMSLLWDNIGAQVIHDDRLIIRNTGGIYRMHNTPVYRNDVPRSAPIDRIFLISHGDNNEMIQIREASAVSMVVANCIQHNYSQDMIARFLGSVSMMCSKVPVSTLSFRPDRSVIEYILRNDQ